MSAVAVCFVTVNVSVSLRTSTTSVPVTGTAMNRRARPCLLRLTSGSMCLSGNKQLINFYNKNSRCRKWKHKSGMARTLSQYNKRTIETSSSYKQTFSYFQLLKCDFLCFSSVKVNLMSLETISQTRKHHYLLWKLIMILKDGLPSCYVSSVHFTSVSFLFLEKHWQANSSPLQRYSCFHLLIVLYI